MNFDELPGFKKDIKGLLKKYRTIEEDLNIVRLILKIKPDERPPFSYNINNLGIKSCIVKVRKIACKSLKGKGVNSGLRLIYAYFPSVKKIIFIELYLKNEKENEDRKRILDNFN